MGGLRKEGTTAYMECLGYMIYTIDMCWMPFSCVLRFSNTQSASGTAKKHEGELLRQERKKSFFDKHMVFAWFFSVQYQSAMCGRRNAFTTVQDWSKTMVTWSVRCQSRGGGPRATSTCIDDFRECRFQTKIQQQILLFCCIAACVCVSCS